MGRRFKGPAQPVQVDDISYEEDDNQEEDGRSIKPEGRNNQVSEDEDYSDKQYPPVDDKYKQLEDRLKVMEIQKVSGLNFGELGLTQGWSSLTSSRSPSFQNMMGSLVPNSI